jgi:hypothetical protein
MTLSLNEIEAAAKKAARGAGYPWGLAEEAAKAVRWLCARDVDGCAALAQLLAQTDGAELADWAPQIGDVWQARGGTLCPLATGAALSDRAVAEVQLGRIAVPVLLAPFAALAARRLGVVTIAWPEMTALTDGDRLCLRGAAGAAADDAALTIGGTLADPNPMRTRCAPDPDAWAALLRLAHRTYAPATEQSRLRGAGAGLSDSD